MITAAGFVVVAVLSMRWVLAAPRSNLRFAVAFALTLLPLLSAKGGAVFDQNLLGFMGVSYLTFKALQVLFEVRDGVIKECGLFDYLYFLLFFPVFTSGPIDRSRRFAEDARAVRSRDEYAGLLARGILLVLVGLVYTFVVAAWLHRFYVPAAWGSGPFLTELAAQVQTAYVYGLYLTEAEGRSHEGAARYPSRFLLDIDPAALEFSDKPSDPQMADARSVYALTDRWIADLVRDARFSVGDRVVHAVFGAGRVSAVDTGKRAYEVEFDGMDTPRTISFKAKLEEA